MAVDFLTTNEISRISGVKVSTLTFWACRGYLKPRVASITGKRGRWRMWLDEDLAIIKTANELRAKGLSLRRAFRIAPAVAELRGWAVIGPDQWFPAHTPEQVVERLERLKVPVVIVRVG